MDNETATMVTLLIQGVVGLTILCIAVKFVQVLLLAERWFRRELGGDAPAKPAKSIDPEKNPEWMTR